MEQSMKPKCVCGHSYEMHSSDLQHPDTEPCWAGAAVGEGCTPVYAERCRDYVPEEANK
jgi:hypothetical protein